MPSTDSEHSPEICRIELDAVVLTEGDRPLSAGVKTSGHVAVQLQQRDHGVYQTSLGISRDAPSEWLRERWQTKRLLLSSGLDATIIRLAKLGNIVSVGGRGCDTIVSQAKRRIAITLGGNRPKMRTIALDDLVYYLVGVLDDPLD
jgi:uncharacterized protein YbjT (DUF2867 family)